MSRINTGRYKPSAENPNKLEYAGQKTAQDVFNELQYRLKAEGYLPDDYFLLDSSLNEKGILFPNDAVITCNVNWGDSEGIYLDIMLNHKNEKGELQHTHFATGKTLGESDNDLDRMYLIAAACTKGCLLEEVDMLDLRKRNKQYVEFAVSDVNIAALLLERQFGTSDYTVCDDNTIRLYDSIGKRGEINSCFVSNGLLVTTVNVSEEKLEDYFSELIGGGGIG